MRLLTKSNLYLLYFSTLAFIASGFIFYYSIRAIVYKQIDDSLITEKDLIQEQIEHTDTIPDFNTALGHLIDVKLLEHAVKKRQIIKDTLIDAENEDADIPYRTLYFTNNTLKHKGYSIRISHPLSEKQDLLEDISSMLLILFLLLNVIFVIVNYWISKRLWVPFYSSLEKINHFEITANNPLHFRKTDIKEFKELNDVLIRMSEKIRSDYINLKEFNENASHEVQTPLSIIRSKLELMMQSDNLTMDQIGLLSTINDSVSRLSKLNQGLLIISKIDNQQFSTKELISLDKLFLKILEDFEELIALKKIKVTTQIESSIEFEMNPILADILANNLISNAIKHNIENGYIRIEAAAKVLSIINSGNEISIDPNLLFNRFAKVSKSNNSVGLGLAIVKKITSFYNLSISYNCIDREHKIEIKFF